MVGEEEVLCVYVVVELVCVGGFIEVLFWVLLQVVVQVMFEFFEIDKVIVKLLFCDVYVFGG